MNLISTALVRPLDILLIRGSGPLSAMSAWTNDSFYSHAAIALSSKRILEGSLAGTRIKNISDALAMEALQVCDVYRFIAVQDVDREELRAHGKRIAKEVLGTFFPRKGLLWVGFVSVLRNHLPVGRAARGLSRRAFDRFLPNRKSKLSCLDVVAGAVEKVKLFGDILVIKRRAPLERVPPKINLKVLYREVRDAANFARAAALKRPHKSQFDLVIDNFPAYLHQLDIKRAHRQQALGNANAEPWRLAQGAIMLSDLETSPSLQLVGRLKSL